jgi:hypothetical protein
MLGPLFFDINASEGGICTCCCFESSDLKCMFEHIDESPESDAFKSIEMRQQLQTTFVPTDGSVCKHSVGQLFKSHLRMDLDAIACKRCARTFQFLYANFYGTHLNLSFVDLEHIPRSTDVYDNDELFEGDIDSGDKDAEVS